MISLVKPIAIASAVSLMAIAPTGAASAQSNSEANGRVEVQTAQAKWKYDSKRHERRRHKDAKFRFHFGGFWYPEPFWLGYYGPYRIGCSDGRAIVRDRGFRSVRTVECQGRSYTYLGRRHGDTFKVVVNARTGRIIDVDRV